MTVAELIKALSLCDPEAVVVVDDYYADGLIEVRKAEYHSNGSWLVWNEDLDQHVERKGACVEL